MTADGSDYFTVSERMEDGRVVVRNLGDGSAVTIRPEDLHMVVEMLVDELSSRDADTEYVLEEFDTSAEDDDEEEPEMVTGPGLGSA